MSGVLAAMLTLAFRLLMFVLGLDLLMKILSS